MKALLLFILTCFVGTGAFLAATTMSNPFPAFIVGFGVWGLFIRRIIVRAKKLSLRREQEQLFTEWLRSQNRSRRHY